MTINKKSATDEELILEAFSYFSEADYWMDRYDEVWRELHFCRGYGQAPMAGVQGVCRHIEAKHILEWISEGPQPDEDFVNKRRSPDDSKSSYVSARKAIGERSSWICIYCQRQGTADVDPDGRIWHIDHIFPKSRGGDSLPDNLILSCATCNLKKHASLASEILLGIKSRLDAEKSRA